MDRRGRDAERGGEAHRGTRLQQWYREVAEWVVPHFHVVDKNGEGYLGGKGSQPQNRSSSSPGFQHQEDKYP